MSTEISLVLKAIENKKTLSENQLDKIKKDIIKLSSQEKDIKEKLCLIDKHIKLIHNDWADYLNKKEIGKKNKPRKRKEIRSIMYRKIEYSDTTKSIIKFTYSKFIKDDQTAFSLNEIAEKFPNLKRTDISMNVSGSTFFDIIGRQCYKLKIKNIRKSDILNQIG